MSVRHARWAVVLLAACGTCAGARAAAQPAPWQPERLNAGWTFTPSIVIGALWDSNVTVQGQGTPEIAEWVGVLNPRGELDFNGRQTHFNIGYSGAIERYRRLPALDRYEQRGRLQFRHQATPRLQVTATGGASDAPTTDRVESGVVPFIDIGSRAVDAGGTSTYTFSPRTAVEASYRFQRIEFDRQASPRVPVFLTGGYAHRPGVHLRHALSSRLAIGGGYEYQRAHVGGGVSTFIVQSAMADGRLRLSERMTLTGSAGAAQLEVEGTNISLWGPSFRAGLTRRSGLHSLYVRYERAFVPSFSFGGLTGNQYVTVGGDAPVDDSGRLTLSGSATYSRTEPVAQLGFTFQLDTLWVNTAIAYRVSRWLFVEAFVTSTHQTSSAQGDVDRTRLGFQFTTSKPVRVQ